PRQLWSPTTGTSSTLCGSACSRWCTSFRDELSRTGQTATAYRIKSKGCRRDDQQQGFSLGQLRWSGPRAAGQAWPYSTREAAPEVRRGTRTRHRPGGGGGVVRGVRAGTPDGAGRGGSGVGPQGRKDL